MSVNTPTAISLLSNLQLFGGRRIYPQHRKEIYSETQIERINNNIGKIQHQNWAIAQYIVPITLQVNEGKCL